MNWKTPWPRPSLPNNRSQKAATMKVRIRRGWSAAVSAAETCGCCGRWPIERGVVEAVVRFGSCGWVTVGSKSYRSARDGRGPRPSAIAGCSPNAPASSECGGPPPLWNTSSVCNAATMVRSLGLRLCASYETEKSIHPLVGKIRLGPQRRRAGRTPRRWRVLRPLLCLSRPEAGQSVAV